MAELADALDSGSSGHCARAGSSPVIRSNADKVIRNDDLFSCKKTEKAKRKIKKPRICLQSSGLFYFAIDWRSKFIRMAKPYEWLPSKSLFPIFTKSGILFADVQI